jgi:hypothetical protein
MKEFKKKARLQNRLIRVLFAYGLTLFPLLIFGDSPASTFRGDPEEGVRNTLLVRYSDLLIEKGICDEKGREIDGRLGKMIMAAQAKGLAKDRQVTDFILRELNYSPSVPSTGRSATSSPGTEKRLRGVTSKPRPKGTPARPAGSEPAPTNGQ